MKRIIFTIAVAGLLAACNSGNTKTSNKGDEAISASGSAVIKFDDSTYNFGTVKQGEKVVYNFKFKNTGNSPLIITAANASCGCTVPEYPHEPVAPGKNGVIKVVFNSAGKSGKQAKAVTITSNAVPSASTVYLEGEVKESETTKN